MRGHHANEPTRRLTRWFMAPASGWWRGRPPVLRSVRRADLAWRPFPGRGSHASLELVEVGCGPEPGFRPSGLAEHGGQALLQLPHSLGQALLRSSALARSVCIEARPTARLHRPRGTLSVVLGRTGRLKRQSHQYVRAPVRVGQGGLRPGGKSLYGLLAALQGRKVKGYRLLRDRPPRAPFRKSHFRRLQGLPAFRAASSLRGNSEGRRCDRRLQLDWQARTTVRRGAVREGRPAAVAEPGTRPFPAASTVMLSCRLPGRGRREAAPGGPAAAYRPSSAAQAGLPRSRHATASWLRGRAA